MLGMPTCPIFFSPWAHHAVWCDHGRKKIGHAMVHAHTSTAFSTHNHLLNCTITIELWQKIQWIACHQVLRFYQIQFWLMLCPRPHWGAYNSLQEPSRLRTEEAYDTPSHSHSLDAFSIMLSMPLSVPTLLSPLFSDSVVGNPMYGVHKVCV